MLDLPVGAAHRRQTVAVGQELRQARVDSCFVFALVCNDALLDNAMRTGDQAISGLLRNAPCRGGKY